MKSKEIKTRKSHVHELIIQKIFVIRNQKVMLDADLAVLYKVPTKRLNEQVKRNIERFPKDFMFRITGKEWDLMRSHFATASNPNSDEETIHSISRQRRNTQAPPYAFTEHGITMLASVLRSPVAVRMSIAVVRAFIELKKSALKLEEISLQLKELRIHLGDHDTQLMKLNIALDELLEEKASQLDWEDRNRIGYKP